jgi:hypothetical protein
MFLKASRLKLRFPLNGNCTTEDLWDFTKETLAELEVKLQENIEKQGKQNRFAKKNGKLAVEELKLSIVSQIIDIKVAEEEESANATIKKQEKAKLLELLAKKQDEKLLGLTEEEIQAKLAEL